LYLRTDSYISCDFINQLYLMIYFLDTFNYILKTWKAVFYTEPILLITLIVAFIISVRFGKDKKGLVLVPFYIVLFIIEILSNYIAAFLYYHKIFNPKEFDFVCYLDYLLTVIELLTFIIFFHSEIKSSKSKSILRLLSLLFCIYFLIELILDSEFPVSVSDNTQSRVYTIEAIILLGGCSFYFIETFKYFPFKNIKEEPSFWIATGLLFFLSCTLPYSLIENYLRKNYYQLMLNFYSIFYIFYSLLFFMIIKAYLCQQKKSI
jgi:hypothetical protein